jgi:hypothetical protein
MERAGRQELSGTTNATMEESEFFLVFFCFCFFVFGFLFGM